MRHSHGQYGLLPWKGERVLILDLDRPELVPVELPPTYRVRRGATKSHAYYRLPLVVDPTQIPAKAAWGEVRVEGANRQVVGPYAVHFTGDLYLPEGSPADMAEIPLNVLTAIFPKVKAGNGSALVPSSGPIPHGQRHNHYLARAGLLKNEGRTPQQIEELMIKENHRRSPDHDEGDLRAIAGSSAEWESAPSVAALPPCLPGVFWTERPYLAHIRQAAWSHRLPPDLVLGVTLARQAAMVEHSIGLPPVVAAESSLSVFVAPVARSGGGKSSSFRTSKHLLPSEGLVEVPGGSGEGLIESYFTLEEETVEVGGKKRVRKVKRQTANNLLAVVDEGQAAMRRESRNAGSTLFASLRSMWTGGVAGEANASAERRRILPGGSYAIGVVLGFQPELIGALLADTASGTPQRFLFLAAHAQMPEVVPDWPGGLPSQVLPLIDAKHKHKVEDRLGYQMDYPYWFDVADAVRAEIIAAHDAKTAGAEVDEFTVHRSLNRLKVAGILAYWDGRLDITTHDWRLAGIVLDTSDGVRKWAQRVVATQAADAERASARRKGRRDAESEEVIDARRQERCRDAIKQRLEKANGPGRSELRRAITPTLRNHFDEALDDLIERRVVEQRVEAGQGSEKVTLWLL